MSKADAGAFRDALLWPPETVIVATVARMEPRKNQAIVIRAIAELRSEGIPLAYICAGDGEEHSRLVETARSLGIEQWVRFPGAVSDGEKVSILAAADVHAMPSIRHGSMIEGFGISFMEAAATGTPSIAGNVGGQSEAVLDGRTGLVIDGSSLSEVRSALRCLTLDPALRERMGREGKKWAAANDWASIVQRTQAAIQRIL
jgi:glycosyltransferase involved in cell wall biosynthesis